MADINEFIDGDPFDPASVEAHEQALAEAEKKTSSIAVGLIERRKRAYAQVFSPGKRSQADIDIVLNDLMWFCRVWVPPYDMREGIHAQHLSVMKEGRREVFQRIKDFSCLSHDALLLKYTDAITK